MRRGAAVFLVLLAIPSTAAASVTLDEFTVTPSNLQAGGHPDVTVLQQMTPSTGDDGKDTFVRLAPGLLGNPQAAPLCTREELHSSSGCAADTEVGTVQVTALINLLPILGVPQTINGTVYNLRPVGSEPARLGIKLQPLDLSPLPNVLPPVFLEAPVVLRQGADGVGLETLFADQPREAAGLDIQLTSVRLTFHGQASRGSFMRMPTSCAPASSLGRVNSYEAPETFSEKSFAFTPVGCETLSFTPSAEGTLGARGATGPGARPPLSTTLRFDPEQAALQRAEVTLPHSLAPTPDALTRACPAPQADASACPESSRVGTAIIDSPLQAEPVQGPVYIAFNTPAALPGLIVMLPPPIDLRIDGVTELGAFGTRNVFPSNPDLPLRSFTLGFEGGANGILQLTGDLCNAATPRAIGVKLTAHNGKVAEFEQELATPSCSPSAGNPGAAPSPAPKAGNPGQGRATPRCKPHARASLKRHGRRYTLAAVVRADRCGANISRARVALPKGLTRGRARPRIRVNGRRVESSRARKAIRPNLGHDARKVKIVWPGLKAKRKLKRTLRVPVTIVDEQGKRTALRLRVKRD